MRYVVVDYYDNPFHGDVIGTFDTLEDAKKECKRYAKEDVDGECDLEIYEEDNNKQRVSY